MPPSLSNLGIGIGLRPPHYSDILSQQPNIDWFEIISENFMVDGGRPLIVLDAILERYPVVQHGVALSIGSAAPLDWDYLKKLKKLTQRTKTPWLSDHLSWGRLEGAHYHDLLPLPYTKEVALFVAERARIVQDFLELPFALENVSSYLTFSSNEMTEWEFVSTVAELSDTYILLDVNNIYVSAQNHHFSPEEYYNNIPVERVIQIHLAGHTKKDNLLIDTHNNFVCDPVWKIYQKVYEKTGGASTLLEWDDDYLSFAETWKEAQKARQYQETYAATTC